MSLIVQKFGGTSVADTEKIRAAARKAIRAHQEGHQVVMVVSAMGHNTDELIKLAQEVSDRPSAREMDMLLSTGEQVSVALMAMAIESMGHRAISFTGAQIGIKTDSTHTKARIRSISTERMKRALAEGQIVIAAGFQGIDEDYNITTLGRGGSDTTAVALAAVLGADVCEIYTDVDGVYTTDPRILPEARLVRRVSYDEMLELASLGAGVMHNRSIEFAKKFGVPIHVRSSFSDRQGSLIAAEPEVPSVAVSGAALVKNEARITILGVPDRPGTSLAIFSRIAARNVTVDMIVQNVGAKGKADISFTVLRDDLRSTLDAVNEAALELRASAWSHDDNVAKVSVVGLGMATQTGVAQRMFQALSDQKINILMISTSEIKISVLVSRDRGYDALRAVHSAFGLEHEPAQAADVRLPQPAQPSTDALDVVDRLRGMQAAESLMGMEEITVNNIDLDEAQALVTINAVPDTPGVAARIFQQIAEGGVFVDMIVQSYGLEGRANLSFTVPHASLDRALSLAGDVAGRLECGGIHHRPHVAKLSVMGIGMRSHTGVAVRMFRALSAARINVEMISTSEVRVNVIVDGEQGKKGKEVLTAELKEVMR
jgi:aspartate kinase